MKIVKKTWALLFVMLATAQMYGQDKFATLAPAEIKTNVSSWLVIIIDIMMGLIILYMAANLVKLIPDVKQNQEGASEKAWKWGGMLIFVMIALGILNFWANKAGVFK